MIPHTQGVAEADMAVLLEGMVRHPNPMAVAEAQKIINSFTANPGLINQLIPIIVFEGLDPCLFAEAVDWFYGKKDEFINELLEAAKRGQDPRVTALRYRVGPAIFKEIEAIALRFQPYFQININ